MYMDGAELTSFNWFVTGTCSTMGHFRKQSLILLCILRKQLPAGVMNALLIISLLSHPLLVMIYFNSKGHSGKKNRFIQWLLTQIAPCLSCRDSHSVHSRCCAGLRVETQQLDWGPKMSSWFCTSAAPQLSAALSFPAGVLGGVAFGCIFYCFHVQK